jgi:hypothetical protein
MTDNLQALILAQQNYIYELEKQLNIKNNLGNQNTSNFNYTQDGDRYYYHCIIDSLLEICSDHNVPLHKCEVCGSCEEYLVDSGSGSNVMGMKCCRVCYPPIFNNICYQVVFYENINNDGYKYMGSFPSIQEARQIALPESGYRCIFHKRKMIEKTFVDVN